ncbi:hypothetical protein [Crocosphaera sp.]|uniref:hypothetical protein n=1 Tax=Crocosphaera sp. TaxID=2729996 RepID=UPI002607533E|nr:hypothetical protein [Crocosphaera sp.]MDJ0579850.1 hypothetical protein [Crocosphaera sp.]
MATLIFPLKLATTSIIFGLIALNSNLVKAETWERNGIVASEDNFSDTRFPGITLGGNNFLAVGQLDEQNGQTGKQVAYLGFDFQNVINDITPFLDAGAEIRNLQATLRFNQTNNAGNDPSGNPLNPNTNPLISPVLSINVRNVDPNSWDENTPIDPNRVNNGQIFFGGSITQGANTRFNSPTAEEQPFNDFISDLLQKKIPEFSLAIEPVTTLNLPFLGVFPGDTLFSEDGGNIDEQPRIDLSFQLWNESFKILDTPAPNFKLQSLAGGSTFKEQRLVKGRDTLDQVLDETDWVWSNNIPTRFELQCSNNQATVTFSANNDNNSDKVITSPVNTCENIEGLKLFSVVKQVAANTSMEICVNEADGSPISDFCSSSNLVVENGGISEETFFYFTDPTILGGLGSTVTNLKGEITMGWVNNNNPQEASENQRVAIQLIPLSTHQDPDDQQSTNPLSTNPNETSNAPSVPESTSVLSLILLGLSGIQLKLSGKNRN